MNKQLWGKLHQAALLITEVFEELSREEQPIQKTEFINIDGLVNRGDMTGTVYQGKLLNVQPPRPGGKSIKLFVEVEGGKNLYIYAGVSHFEVDDLTVYEGYPIAFTMREVVTDTGSFQGLTGWRPQE